MKILTNSWPFGAGVLLLLASGAAQAQTAAREAEEPAIDEITVVDRRVANTDPAGSYATLATLLRFDPSTELQSRGLPEGQADITVRGGLFENTGFKLGAVTVIDPQTGHYAAELPLDAALLSGPDIKTGAANFLAGFNSNIATVSYSLLPLQSGGSAVLGAGSDSLNFQSLRFARTTWPDTTARWGFQASAAFSEGDGSVDDGDHDFERFNVQLQRQTERSQSDIVIAYQDKFYGWPGAYTGFATLAETDHTKTMLLFLNHRSDADNGWWEASAFYRELEDDYDFDRTTQESGAPGSFDHETRVYGAGVHGQLRRAGWDWNFAAQLTSDELVRSTDLTEGEFTSRDYASIRIVPSVELARSDEHSLQLQVGASLDISNRDSNEVAPLIGLRYSDDRGRGGRFIGLDYAATSQLPGYTVLNSRTTGLFGGNPDLGREEARQLSLSLGQMADEWQATMTVFLREDDDLVDWTYQAGAPFARQANEVDIDVVGIELRYSRDWERFDLTAGYTYLDKDADYAAANVDASFYALNYARHRATLALMLRFSERLELRLDNEYRDQEENPLRQSASTAYHAAASLVWRSAKQRGFGVRLTADNLTDEDYEQFPGTPAVGRQYSISANYDW